MFELHLLSQIITLLRSLDTRNALHYNPFTFTYG
jgi:hypothetical protein